MLATDFEIHGELDIARGLRETCYRSDVLSDRYDWTRHAVGEGCFSLRRLENQRPVFLPHGHRLDDRGARGPALKALEEVLCNRLRRVIGVD